MNVHIKIKLRNGDYETVWAEPVTRVTAKLVEIPRSSKYSWGDTIRFNRDSHVAGEVMTRTHVRGVLLYDVPKKDEEKNTRSSTIQQTLQASGIVYECWLPGIIGLAIPVHLDRNALRELGLQHDFSIHFEA